MKVHKTLFRYEEGCLEQIDFESAGQVSTIAKVNRNENYPNKVNVQGFMEGDSLFMERDYIFDEEHNLDTVHIFHKGLEYKSVFDHSPDKLSFTKIITLN